MKNKYLFLLSISLLLSNVSHSQVYFPLPESNAMWCETYIYTDGMSGWYTDDNTKFIGGDTIINLQPHKKIYQSGHLTLFTLLQWPYNFDLGYYFNQYMGAIRQDTTNHTAYFATDSEYLLYDFNLVAGDSFPGIYDLDFGKVPVISVDSILVGNDFRKRINFFGGVSWMEGIGATSGLLGHLGIFEDGGFLNALEVNGITIYPDSTLTCDIATSILSVQQNNSSLLIYPNPAHDQITVRLPKPLNKFTMRIRNSLGETVLEKDVHLSSSLLQINLQHFSSGVYSILVWNGEELFSGRVIRE